METVTHADENEEQEGVAYCESGKGPNPLRRFVAVMNVQLMRT